MGRLIILFMFLSYAAYRDLKDRIIPDWVPCSILIVSLILPGTPSIAGALACVPLLIAGLTMGGIGGGDIKITGACGLVLGFHRAVMGLFIALCLLVLYHKTSICIKRIRKLKMNTGKEQAYPLVPFLLLGMLCSIGIGYIA